MMSDKAKKGLLIGIVVVAAICAGFGVMNFARGTGDNMDVIDHHVAPPGHKSEKEIALESQGASADARPAQGSKSGDDSALAGDTPVYPGR